MNDLGFVSTGFPFDKQTPDPSIQAHTHSYSYKTYTCTLGTNIHIHRSTYMHAYMHILHTRAHAHIHSHKHVRMHTYMHTYIHTNSCVHAHIYTCTHTCTQIHMYMHTYTCTCVHTFTSTCMHICMHMQIHTNTTQNHVHTYITTLYWSLLLTHRMMVCDSLCIHIHKHTLIVNMLCAHTSYTKLHMHQPIPTNGTRKRCSHGNSKPSHWSASQAH